MKGNLLQKYAPIAPGEAWEPDEENGESEDLGMFGLLRGHHERAMMLELRHKDGNAIAFGYAWLSHAEFDPSEGITLHFGSKKVTISGRNLTAELRPNVRLFAAILRHRISWIQEADARTVIASTRDAIVVEEIKVAK